MKPIVTSNSPLNEEQEDPDKVTSSYILKGLHWKRTQSYTLAYQG